METWGEACKKLMIPLSFLLIDAVPSLDVHKCNPLASVLSFSVWVLVRMEHATLVQETTKVSAVDFETMGLFWDYEIGEPK